MDYQSKKLINNPLDVVTEFIEGLVETYHGLQHLDGFPEVKVVLRADVSRGTYDKVAVISGGGSGHEPAHAGFVGEGMLTAAICGDVFASPPVDSILAGIRAVTGPMGCLLIVKNYTGDRLNFGLAAKQAKSEGYKVEMVIVGDDCALSPPRDIAGRRGLAGTIFVHKVAGAAAACGLSLKEVAAEAKQASDSVGTMGVALSICTLPGQVITDRLGAGKMEIGVGIHGEPGGAVVEYQQVDGVVSHVLNQILSQETKYVPITRGSRVVVMVNGLGATPLMELMIVAGKVVPRLQSEHGLAVDRVYTGSFMTSLDTAGFSVSIMLADQAILSRLDAPTKATDWPVSTDGNRPLAKRPVPLPPSPLTKNEEASSSSSTPVDLIPVFPNELSEKILHYLPVKSLIRLTAVSKQLFTFIKSPNFIKSHLLFSHSHSPRDHHVFLFNVGENSTLNQAPLPPFLTDQVVSSEFVQNMSDICGRRPSFVGSIDGLVCFAVSRRVHEIEEVKVYICNLTTRNHRALPILRIGNDESFLYYGFGRVEYDEYRVFVVAGYRSYLSKVVEYDVSAFSLKSDSWNLVNSFRSPYLLRLGRGIAVNGKLHWTTFPHEHKRVIFSIDIGDASLGQLELPYQGEGLSLSMHCLKDMISVIRHFMHRLPELWVMKNYGVEESWMKLAFFSHISMSCSLDDPVWVFSNEEILFSSGCESFVLYRTEDNSWRTVRFQSHLLDHHFVCLESLLSP